MQLVNWRTRIERVFPSVVRAASAVEFAWQIWLPVFCKSRVDEKSRGLFVIYTPNKVPRRPIHTRTHIYINYSRSCLIPYTIYLPNLSHALLHACTMHFQSRKFGSVGTTSEWITETFSNMKSVVGRHIATGNISRYKRLISGGTLVTFCRVTRPVLLVH